MTLRSLLGIACAGVLVSALAGSLAAGASPETLPPLRAWPDEELAGGATTVHDDTPTAYGRALANLDRGRWAAMRAGKRLFESPWRSPDEVAVTAPRRGLGPLHNATACTDCHFRDGRGGPAPASSRSQPGEPVLTLAPLLAKLSLPSAGLVDGPDPTYGAQLNDRGTGAPPEGRLVLEDERVTLDDGTLLVRPRARVTDLSRGPLHPQTSISLRTPPTLVGLGLLEAVPDASIEALADPDDRDGDGISGRVRRLDREGREGGGDGRVGRFGWKAGEATLEGQIAKAFHQDLGVTSPLYTEPNCPPGDDACRGARGEVELDPDDLRRVVLYTQLLAPPARRDWRDPPGPGRSRGLPGGRLRRLPPAPPRNRPGRLAHLERSPGRGSAEARRPDHPSLYQPPAARYGSRAG